MGLFVPEKSLDGPLPPYQHVLAWGSTHYGLRATVLADFQTLVRNTPVGGSFIAAAPTINDIVARESAPMDDGTRRINTALSGQTGAAVTIPATADEFAAWCDGIAIDDLGTFGWKFGGKQTEFHFLYGTRK